MSLKRLSRIQGVSQFLLGELFVDSANNNQLYYDIFGNVPVKCFSGDNENLRYQSGYSFETRFHCNKCGDSLKEKIKEI